MFNAVRSLLERFWVWLGGDVWPAGLSAVVPGPGQFVYTVQPGDTLHAIAHRFSTSIWVLAAINELDDLRQIHAGQPLLIPRRGAPLVSPTAHASESIPAPAVEPEAGPFIYIVRTSDTMSDVARRFRVTSDAIIQANRLPASSPLWPGQRLLIPGAEVRPAQPIFE
jgi:LysM repeat protein